MEFGGIPADGVEGCDGPVGGGGVEPENGVGSIWGWYPPRGCGVYPPSGSWWKGSSGPGPGAVGGGSLTAAILVGKT